MGRAYRTDVIESEQLAEAISETEAREDVLPSEEVLCPVLGCATSYVLYNYASSDTMRNRAELQQVLTRDHPTHPEQLVIAGKRPKPEQRKDRQKRTAS